MIEFIGVETGEENVEVNGSPGKDGGPLGIW
jgi:hypothetical protein